MNQKELLNIEIKNAVTAAFYQILNNKPFSEITVSELIIKAGVARATFYRNFKNKEDVLTYHLKSILTSYHSTFIKTIESLCSYNNIYQTFVYLKDYTFELEVLFKSKLSQYLLDTINEYIIEYALPNLKRGTKKFSLYAYSGALYNCIYFWITKAPNIDLKEISRELYNSVNVNSIENK